MKKHIIEVWDAETGGFMEAIYLDGKEEVSARLDLLNAQGKEAEYIGVFDIDEGVEAFLTENK